MASHFPFSKTHPLGHTNIPTIQLTKTTLYLAPLLNFTSKLLLNEQKKKKKELERKEKEKSEEDKNG